MELPSCRHLGQPVCRGGRAHLCSFCAKSPSSLGQLLHRWKLRASKFYLPIESPPRLWPWLADCMILTRTSWEFRGPRVIHPQSTNPRDRGAWRKLSRRPRAELTPTPHPGAPRATGSAGHARMQLLIFKSVSWSVKCGGWEGGVVGQHSAGNCWDP